MYPEDGIKGCYRDVSHMTPIPAYPTVQVAGNFFSVLSQHNRTGTRLLVNAFPREGVSRTVVLGWLISGRSKLAITGDILQTEQTIDGPSKGIILLPLLVPFVVLNIFRDSVNVLYTTNPARGNGIGTRRDLAGCSAKLEVDELIARY
jgi:hypothetical protein